MRGSGAPQQRRLAPLLHKVIPELRDAARPSRKRTQSTEARSIGATRTVRTRNGAARRRERRAAEPAPGKNSRQSTRHGRGPKAVSLHLRFECVSPRSRAAARDDANQHVTDAALTRLERRQPHFFARPFSALLSLPRRLECRLFCTDRGRGWRGRRGGGGVCLSHIVVMDVPRRAARPHSAPGQVREEGRARGRRR